MTGADVSLAARRCVPCEAGTPPLTDDATTQYLARLGEGSGWEIVEGKKIVKSFRFKSFRDAIAFVNRVAEIAEGEGHHPDMWISYRRVRLELMTHAIGGLSENDFILAAKIDRAS